MSFLSYIQTLKSNLPKVARGVAAIQIVAANEMEFRIKRRIQNYGLDSNGDPIFGGSYSTRPLYVNVDKLPPSIAARAKTNKIVKAKAKQDKTAKALGARENKTLFLLGGYDQLRELANKETSYVNLTFTGGTLNEVRAISKGKGATVAIIDTKANEILTKHETRNGKPIVAPTKTEVEEVDDVVIAALDKIVLDAI